MRTFEAILSDIANSCNRVLYSGYRNNYAEVIEAATKIYIAELQKDKQTVEFELTTQCIPAATSKCSSDANHEWELMSGIATGITYCCKKCNAIKIVDNNIKD